MHLRLVLPLLCCAACALPGCKHDVDTAPRCYSGVVLGNSCPDGTLIQVDSQYSIGRAVEPYLESLSGVPASDSIGSTNLIAAVNPAAVPYKQGQRIYFTYQNDPQQQRTPYSCYVFGPLSIPHFVLSNVSAAPCGPTTP